MRTRLFRHNFKTVKNKKIYCGGVNFITSRKDLGICLTLFGLFCFSIGYKFGVQDGKLTRR